MSNESEEAQLIQQAQRGHLEATEQLLGAYQKALFAFLYRRLGHRQDAEDALQKVFIKVLNGMKRYNHQGFFKAWIYRIAYNEAMQVIRKRARNPLSLVEADAPDTQAGPDENLAKQEEGLALRAWIDDLPQAERDVIQLRLDGDLSFKEIAQIVDAPLGTVLARMHRGVEKLKARGLLER